MGLKPNIKKKANFTLKTCPICGGHFGSDNFVVVKSPFYPDGTLPFCNSCLDNYLREHDYDWSTINKLCQMVDIPFVPEEVEKLKQINPTGFFPVYAQIFLDSEYDDLGWDDYYQRFKQLKQAGYIEDELPELREEKRKEQRARWGANYDDEALDYLDNLFNGLLTTQNVNGALQVDQALKICKMSYEIDCRMRAGEDFDKLLSSYDKTIKAAEFTPKNVKNINDFDSCGELVKWMEKRGWRNKFFDGVTQDIVDETIKNIQNFNQRLYINETGLGDSITQRIESLKSVAEKENYYSTNQDFDLDAYDNDGFNDLMNDDFEADTGGGCDV